MTTSVLDRIKELHTPKGNFTCGFTTDGPVPHRHNGNRYSDPVPLAVLTCSKAFGHEGSHEDAVCCWNFQTFEDGIPGTSRDCRVCSECHQSWPCPTARCWIGADMVG